MCVCLSFCAQGESRASSRSWSTRWETGSCSIRSCSVWLVWLMASSTCSRERCEAGPAGHPIVGHLPSGQRTRARCGLWRPLATPCPLPTVWHSPTWPAIPAALGTSQADRGGHQCSQAQWQDKEGLFTVRPPLPTGHMVGTSSTRSVCTGAPLISRMRSPGWMALRLLGLMCIRLTLDQTREKAGQRHL